MTVLNPPIGIAARVDHNADDLRGALAASFMSQGVNLGPRPRAGIIPGWGKEFSVAQTAVPGIRVLVGSGKLMVPAPVDGVGGWILVNDADLQVDLAPAHATLPRTDLIIARVSDVQYTAGGDGNATIKVVTGVAGAGSPVPTIPAAEGVTLVLARVAVAAAAASVTNANITLNTNTTRPYTVAAGGVLPVANAAARTALTAYLGLHVIEADTKREYAWDGAAWKQLVFDPVAWTAYTPTWTNATTNPAIGNGTLIGRWMQVGKIVHFYISVAMGSTTTYGTGASWAFTLPIAGQDAYAGGAHTAQAFCAATRYGGATVEVASTSFRVVLNNVIVGESTPGTWISGNLLIVRGTYEPA